MFVHPEKQRVRQGSDGEASRDADFEKFAATLQGLAKRVRALFGIALAEAGYQNGQDHLLISLSAGEEVPVSVLADNLDVRPSTISKMIDRLADRELIERFHDHRDRRKTLVRLTEAGVAAQAEIQGIWKDVGRRIAFEMPEKFSLNHLDELNDGLAVRLRKLR